MARKGIALSTLVVGLLMSVIAFPARSAVAADNPVVTENLQPGTSAWQLSQTADDVNGQIKGYADTTSVLQGGSVNLYVTVNPAQTFSVDVYRIGWYGGLGGRLRLHAGPITGATQPACPADATTGMIECGWTASYTVAVGADWTSGVYLTLLTNAAGWKNYVPFVVRDGRPAQFLYQSAVNTGQAYNNYPNDQKTGKSLYEWNSFGANTVTGTTRAAKVSFNRPYSNYGDGNFVNWELQAVRWLERSGYDVTYTTDVDTHANGAELLRHKALLSAGHDEYWSKAMYDAAQNARDAGVSLAFLGADAVHWQARYEASAAGVANRVLVCYRYAALDPVPGPTATLQWRDPLLNRPEQTLMGVMYTSEVAWGNNVPYVVTNSSHWAYLGTGFNDGSSVAGLVGYEMDRLMSTYPAPTAISQTLLSRSPFTNTAGVADYANSSLYQAPSKAWVFASGTMSWSWALDNAWTSAQTDPRIQQTMATILNAFLNGQPVVTSLKLTAPATVPAGQAFTVAVVAQNELGNPVTTYGGTVHFSGTDTSTSAVLPADSKLTNGQGSFSATLATAGAQTITATDTVNGTVTGKVTIQITPLAASSLALVTPANAVVNTPFSMVVTLRDRFGNVATGYTGTVTFSTSDVVAMQLGKMPVDYPFTSQDAGTHTFSGTLMTVPSQTITAADTVNASLSATNTVTVSAVAPLGLVVIR
jgi:hypothetical protein